jgi:asparagine synthase (glutamine-hydrolysing)
MDHDSLPSLRLFGLCERNAPREQLQSLAQRAAAPFAGSAAKVASTEAGTVGIPGAAGHWLAQEGGVTVALAGRPRFAAREAAGGDDPARRFLARFRARGTDALQELQGSFALAVLQADPPQALLAIDRMGIEALCYALAGERLAFGTRADVVAQLRGVPPEIDPQAVYDYLFFHMVPAPETIFRGVSKLLPGHSACWSEGRLRVEPYWRMKYVDRRAVPEEQLIARFRQAIEAGVQRQADGEGIGAFLSGGTDSTTVAGTLARMAAGPVDAFSIGFDAAGFDETEYARIAARHFGLRHHEHYVTPDAVVEAVPLVAQGCDEPFGNASAVAAYHCARFAREAGMQALLAGDGGDELFGGNARYAKQRIFEAYFALPSGLRSGVIEPLLLGPDWIRSVPPLRKLRSYVEQARIALPDRLESYNFLLRDSAGAVLSPALAAAVDRERPFALMREAYFATDSTSPVNRMMLLDLRHTLADNDLRKVNVACRLAGIEPRYPMLDDDLVALSGEFAPQDKVRGLRLRYLFKQALRDFLPPQILGKTKHGFGLPFGLWLAEHPPLRELAGDSLQSLRRRDYVRPEYIDSLLSRHQQEHASYYGVMVWVLMMLELWLQGGLGDGPAAR